MGLLNHNIKLKNQSKLKIVFCKDHVFIKDYKTQT